MKKQNFFSITKNDAEVKIQKSDNNVSISNIDFSSLGRNAGILKVGKMDSGGYAVVVGGIINKSGEFEKHGRWLPYPILIPMMVGTALSIEKVLQFGCCFEIGKLSQICLREILVLKNA